MQCLLRQTGEAVDFPTLCAYVVIRVCAFESGEYAGHESQTVGGLDSLYKYKGTVCPIPPLSCGEQETFRPGHHYEDPHIHLPSFQPAFRHSSKSRQLDESSDSFWISTMRSMTNSSFLFIGQSTVQLI